MKVFIIDKETGEAKEIKGVVSISVLAVEPSADEAWKPAHNFSVKAKPLFKSRREEKEFRKWARSLPKPRLATKAEIAAEITRLLQSQGKVLVPTFARKSRKELAKLYLQLKERIYDPSL